MSNDPSGVHGQQSPSTSRPGRSATLDDREVLALDRSRMLCHAAELGTGFSRSWWSTLKMTGIPPAGAVGAVVVAAVGGSASSGDYLAALAHDESPVPVHVIRTPTLPAYVRPDSLVVACSYSGNTREVLALYDQARARGTALYVVSSGGELRRRAAEDGTPTWNIDYSAPPRAAFSHALGPLLRLSSRLGIIDVADEEVHLAARAHEELAETFGPESLSQHNPAKRVAAHLVRRFTLVLAAEHLEPAAVRFRNQLAENGKAFSASGTIPEVGHNLVVAVDGARFAAPRGVVVTLESARYRSETKHAFDETAGLFEEARIPVHRLRFSGTSRLADMLEATAWADFTSCYLALAQRLDPSPIRPIERLKAAMESRALGSGFRGRGKT